MKYAQATPGRIFVIRLEDGEILHEVIEGFARKHKIASAFLVAVGGADRGSRLVAGPEEENRRPVPPLIRVLEEVSEIAGIGTIFPGEDGTPLLHIHLACGHGDKTVTGCGRTGVKIWQVAEVVLCELTGTEARRIYEPDTGFTLLDPQPDRVKHQKDQSPNPG